MNKSITGLQDQDNNVGSIIDLLFISVDDVDEILKPSTDRSGYKIYAGNCLQFDGDDVVMHKIEFTEDTGIMGYKNIGNANAPLFDIEVSVLVPKDYVHRSFSFEEMSEDKFFVITRDYNYKSRLIGFINLHDEKYGLTFTDDFTTSKTRNGRNGFELKFSMQSILRPQPIEDISEVVISSGSEDDPSDGGGSIPVPPPDI